MSIAKKKSPAGQHKKAPNPLKLASLDQYALGVTFKSLPTVLQIKKLHPKIAFVNIVARTYCEISFASQADRKDAVDKFKKLLLKGRITAIKTIDPGQHSQPLNATPKGQFHAALNRLVGNIENVLGSNFHRPVTNGVFIRDLPRDIRSEEIEELFPDALDVTVLVPKLQTKGAGVALTMPSPADALKARKRKKLLIRGKAYRPEFQRDGKMTLRQAKRLAQRGHFAKEERVAEVAMGTKRTKRFAQPPRYFMEPDFEIKEEKLDQDEVDAIMKIYD